MSAFGSVGMQLTKEQIVACLEETELLPMAARVLGEDQLASIGRAMRKRRGIPDDA